MDDESRKPSKMSKLSPTQSATAKPQLNDKFQEVLREMILQDKIKEPLVFRKVHEDWKPCKWTLEDWGDIFRDEKLLVRYGKQKWDSENPQWESLCENLEITWKKMIEWVRGEYTLPVPDSSPTDVWMYYDYKYLPEVVHLKSESEKDFLKLIYLSENLKKKFCWSKLGFPERNGDHSTLWIGTAGSYTNMHFDTYACNLICQVYGKKTWLVFPPMDSEHLRPTRVPYEESSVYSQINFASDEQMLKNKSALQKCTPRRITLEAGDCLFLPPKWWHFVKSVDLSVSVNTWIELPSDHFTRVEEAILRAVVASFVNSSSPSAADKILNPNEMDLTEVGEKDSEETLRLASKAYLHHRGNKVIIPMPKHTQSPQDVTDTESTAGQNRAVLVTNELEELRRLSPVRIDVLQPFELATEFSEHTLPSVKEKHPTPDTDNRRENPSANVPNYLEDVINAVGHPDLLKQIAQTFLHFVEQRKSREAS